MEGCGQLSGRIEGSVNFIQKGDNRNLFLRIGVQICLTRFNIPGNFADLMLNMMVILQRPLWDTSSSSAVCGSDTLAN